MLLESNHIWFYLTTQFGSVQRIWETLVINVQVEQVR